MLDTSVIMMAKAPRPGFVKTRLQGKLSRQQCAELYKCFLLDMAYCVLQTGYKFYIFFTPEGQEGFFKTEIPGACLFPQKGDDLGKRMANAIEAIYSKEKKKLIIIGGDVPVLKPIHLKEASVALETSDIILGPSLDGGYYLIGLQNPQPALFEGISWGTSRVFSETMARVKELDLSYYLLPELMDIDNFEDLLKLKGDLLKENRQLSFLPLRTRKWLQQNRT